MPLRVQIARTHYRYPNLKAAAKAHDLPYPVVYRRVKAGWKVSKALTTTLRPHKPAAYVPHPDVVAHAARQVETSATRH